MNNNEQEYQNQNNLEQESENGKTELENQVNAEGDKQDESNTPLKSKKIYKHKFNEGWKQKFIWVVKQSDTEALCKVCNVVIAGSISNLKRHNQCNSHIANFNAARSTPSVEKLFQNPAEKTVDERVKEGELKLVMFLAEHNLPFSLMDHLPQMIASVCPDSKIAHRMKNNFKRKKATQLTTAVLGPSSKEELVKDLKENYFSLIIDETTDISTSKCLAIITRYYKNNVVFDRFFDLVEVQSSSAQDLFNAIQYSLDMHKIPLKNVIGLGADNCSVMLGNIKGVKALFEKINPNMITIDCTCHSFHLCSSYACEKLPRSVEQLARYIYNSFSNSSKRCIELKEFEIFMNEKPHVMLRPSQTRWLSLQSVVERIPEH